MTTLGVIFPPDNPPEDLHDVALAADGSGLDELWLWEDCFKESGLATAAAVLAWTGRLGVGIGLLPVPLRNVAITAMEVATLARLFPGRLRPGVGHGVLDWMGQVGARESSPMTLLDEYTAALRQLLHGATVSVSGRYVRLDDVTLDWPPRDVPPLLVGAVGERTLQLSGRLGDGVILTGETTLDGLRAALPHVLAGRAESTIDAAPEVIVFGTVVDRPDAGAVVDQVQALAEAGATTVALQSVGDSPPPLVDFAQFLGEQVAPRLH